MLKTEIVFFGHRVLAVCDRKCEKAWGYNGRRNAREGCGPAAIEYDEKDDVVYLADDEVGLAPDDPGTYEGGHGKPMRPDQHNKWCVRECERCSIINQGEEIVFGDFSARRYNQPSRHPEVPAPNPVIRTGEIYRG